MYNSRKWIIKRDWVELCLADVVTNIAEILKHFFQQVTIGCLAAKLCHTQRSNAFHANARKVSETASWNSTAQLWGCYFYIYWTAPGQGYIIVIPHISPGKMRSCKQKEAEASLAWAVLHPLGSVCNPPCSLLTHGAGAQGSSASLI